jgi:serine/threonine-protein kinase ATR
MAPRQRSVRPTQNGVRRGIELKNGNHLPPPSTIAAQIVHNRSNVARQEPENKALFGKLLQEYLRDPIIEDSNVDTNASLVQVVAEAGLDVMLTDDPFAPDNLLQQAKDSLLVIKLTISRKPEVLLYHGDEANERPPLMLWLLTKILKLLGRKHLDAIQGDLSTLLSTMITILGRHNKTLRQMHAFRNMLVKLVEGRLIKVC